MSHSVDVSERAGVRFLHFGNDWVQGAMRVARPNFLELPYTREMLAGLLWRSKNDWPRQILIIGLGAGSLVRFLHRYLPQAKLTVVEINPEVVAVARFMFKLPPEGPRLRILIDDGYDFIQKTEKSWDTILVDGFDDLALPGELQSSPFYSACRYRLNPGGWLTCNLFSGQPGFAPTCDRLHNAFDGQCVILPPCESGNAIGLAYVEQAEPAAARPSYTDLEAQAAAIADETLLDLAPLVSRLQQAYPEPPAL